MTMRPGITERELQKDQATEGELLTEKEMNELWDAHLEVLSRKRTDALNAKVFKDGAAKAAKPRAGHPRYYEILHKLADVHNVKNQEYAKKGEDPLGNFVRVGAILGMYPGLDPSDPRVVALIYALKQWDAVMNMLAKGYEGAIEGIASRLTDDAVYKLLTLILDERQKNEAGHGDCRCTEESYTGGSESGPCGGLDKAAVRGLDFDGV